MSQQPDVCKAPQDNEGPEKRADVVSDKVERKGDGEGEGAASRGAALATPLTPVRHVLPQIPTMSHSRLAVSKASRKETVPNSSSQLPVLNIVPQAELEKPKVLKPKTPEEDLVNQSENPAKQSEDPVQKCEDLVEKSEDIVKKSDDPAKQSEDPVVKSEDLVGKNAGPLENSEDVKETRAVATDGEVKPAETIKSEDSKETSQAEETTKEEITHSDQEAVDEKVLPVEEPSQTTENVAEKTSQNRSVEEKKTPIKTRDASTDSANPPAEIPTPPSEDPSPKVLAQQKSPQSGSPPTPIKLRIKRNTESVLTSSVTIGEEGQDGASIEVHGQQDEQPSRSSSGSSKRQGKSKAAKKVSRRLSSKQQEQVDSPVKEIAAEEEEAMHTEPPISMEPTEEALKAATIDPNVEPEYNVGDMLWAKVGGHPFWACMVSRDPFDHLYWKQREKKKPFGPPQIFFMYHVQFFGEEAERAWVSESAVIPYEGVNAFHELCREMSVKTKSNKAKYEIKGGRRRAWDIAVVSAEDAFSLDVEERCAAYTFNYSQLYSKHNMGVNPAQDAAALPNGAIQRKRKDGDRGDELSKPPKKKRKVSSVLSDTEDARFSVFCQKRRKSVLDDNPNLTDLEVEDELREQWSKMPVDVKLKFIPMGSDVKHVTGLMKAKTPEGKRRRSLRPVRKCAQPEAERAEEEVESEHESGQRRRRSVRAPEPMEVDSASESVASGAAAESKPQKVKRKKSLLDNVINEDTASETTSQSGDDFASRNKKYDFTGCDPMGDLPFDYHLELLKLSGSGPKSKECVCVKCEEIGTGALLQCEGACEATFHPRCAGLSRKPSGAFRCKACQTGQHECFVCKKTDGDVRLCRVAHCGKFYHMDCISGHPQARIENDSIYCPLHVCCTCVNDNPKNPKCSKGRFFKCVRCPTAYHVGETCIAAGSMVIEGSVSIVCSQHFQPVKTNNHHSHINVSWCFNCSKGGTLLCCESCPAAYHVDCLGLESFPEGSFFCKDCKTGRRPLYGDLVWVKLGGYRWWPGEICHHTNVPLNIQEKSHQVGEFPVRFFGSHDYFWTHQGRLFPFQEGDLSSRECNSGTSIMKQFAKGVREATAAFRMVQKVREVKAEAEERRGASKPRPFKYIKVNVPVGNVAIYKPDLSAMPRCDCRKGSTPPPCSELSNCMNRMLMYECHQQLCPAKDECENQRFQRRTYPEFKIFRTAFGWGLKSVGDIKKGQFVIEYVGELIDDVECKRRLIQQHADDVDDFYILTLDRGRFIDAGPKGNKARFINHSCDPNCETVKWNVNGDVRVGLFATRDITAGDELTFNYNLDCLGNDKKKCQCGAPNCSGYLGEPPKNSDGKVKDKKRKKKKLKKKRNRVHEDECYRCGEGGELVMCDRSWCPKAFHLTCLGLSKPPNGKWECPWHHCDVCGKSAIMLCSECPNSFCKLHIEDNIFDVAVGDSGGGKLLCSDHEELAALESSRIRAPEMPPPGDPRFTSSSASSASAASTPRAESQSEDDDDDDSAAENLVIDETRGAGDAAAPEKSAAPAEAPEAADTDSRRARSHRSSHRPDSGDSAPAHRSARHRKSDVAQEHGSKESNNNITENQVSEQAAKDNKSGESATTEANSSAKRKRSTGGQKSRKHSVGSSKKKKRQAKDSSKTENGQSQAAPDGGAGESNASQAAETRTQDNSTDDEFGNLVIDIPQ